MSNYLTNFSVLTRLLVEMAAGVKLKHCEPIESLPKSFCTIYSQESRDLTCLFHMWLDLPKGALFAHNFKSHFSPPLDRYSNKLTVHAYTIAKASTVCFYWGLIHGPVWHPRVLGWSVNGSNLPGQAENRQGITTRLAGETGHRSSYILGHVELKTAWIEAIWP